MFSHGLKLSQREGGSECEWVKIASGVVLSEAVEEVKVLLHEHVLREEMRDEEPALEVKNLPYHAILPMQQHLCMEIIPEKWDTLYCLELLNFTRVLSNTVEFILALSKMRNSSQRYS